MFSRFIFILLAVLNGEFYSGAQTWSSEQWMLANTISTEESIGKVEHDALIYLNLARLFPKEFAQIELADFPVTDVNANSLKGTLKRMKPQPAIIWNTQLEKLADCFVNEQGATRKVGHKRMRCPAGFNAECISYGMSTGRDIILQLLIDYGNPDFGHRKICLSFQFHEVGIKSGSHVLNETMAVLDFY